MSHLNTTEAELGVWACLNQIPNVPNLRKLMLTMTRAHLAAPDNYGPLKEFLGDLVWSEDDTARTVRVDLQHEMSAGPVQDSLPAIFFGIGTVTFTEEVTGNYAGHSDDRSVEYQVVGAQAPLQWVCCANSADLASNLSETIFSFFRAIRGLLIDRAGMTGFHLQEIEMPIRVVEPDKAPYYRVDLRGMMNYNHVIGIHTESHRLKKIVLESTAGA